jgi:hypothetical protein
MAMFSIKTDEIQKLENELSRVVKHAIPSATKNTINEAAAVTMRMAQAHVTKQMTLRNKWTEKSIKVRKTKAREISRQVAVVGSLQDYMEDQEFGAIKRRKGKEGVPIPTGYASGEGRTSRPRKRLPKGNKAIRKIRLGHGRKRPLGQPKHNKQALLFKVQDAVMSGNRFIFHDFGGVKKKGIFRVVGGRKGFKRDWPSGAKLEMVYSLEHSFVRIPRDPWLAPSVELIKPHIPEIYVKSLKAELKRLNLLQP